MEEEPGAPADLPELLDRRHPPRPPWMRALAVAAAAGCIVLGIVGWLVPVVTGLPFYAAALVLLAVASERVRGWINRLERRLPRAARLALRRAVGRR